MKGLTIFAIGFLAALHASAQTQFVPPRLADGHPDFGGIWMAASLSAAFNVEEHAASYGTPAGPSVTVITRSRHPRRNAGRPGWASLSVAAPGG